MTQAFTPAQRAWLTEHAGQPGAAWTGRRLPGGTSSTVLALRAGEEEPRFVLRLLDNADWLTLEPDLVAHEAAALEEARRANLPVPRVVATEPSGAVFGAPALLMTSLPGRVLLAPEDGTRWTDLLASNLARIHAHDAPAFPWNYRSWLADADIVVPAWTDAPLAWEAALAELRRLRASLERRAARWTTFLHRDYHPLNLLFSGAGETLDVTAIVDWVNACVGPPEADVAHCRVNLTLMHGVAAADAFLAAYLRAAALHGRGFEYDRAWDAEAVYEMGAPAHHAPWAELGLPSPGPAELRRRVEELVLGHA